MSVKVISIKHTQTLSHIDNADSFSMWQSKYVIVYLSMYAMNLCSILSFRFSCWIVQFCSFRHLNFIDFLLHFLPFKSLYLFSKRKRTEKQTKIRINNVIVLHAENIFSTKLKFFLRSLKNISFCYRIFLSSPLFFSSTKYPSEINLYFRFFRRCFLGLFCLFF